MENWFGLNRAGLVLVGALKVVQVTDSSRSAGVHGHRVHDAVGDELERGRVVAAPSTRASGRCRAASLVLPAILGGVIALLLPLPMGLLGSGGWASCAEHQFKVGLWLSWLGRRGDRLAACFTLVTVAMDASLLYSATSQHQ